MSLASSPHKQLFPGKLSDLRLSCSSQEGHLVTQAMLQMPQGPVCPTCGIPLTPQVRSRGWGLGLAGVAGTEEVPCSGKGALNWPFLSQNLFSTPNPFFYIANAIYFLRGKETLVRLLVQKTDFLTKLSREIFLFLTVFSSA